MRCADGYREGTKSIRRCVYRKQLDLDTLDARTRMATSSPSPEPLARTGSQRRRDLLSGELGKLVSELLYGSHSGSSCLLRDG